MPWKECDQMSEKLKFIARLLEGERMTDLCQEFGISRKTGYKFLDRYKDYGASGLNNLNQRPHRSPNKTSKVIENHILQYKEKYPTWGARKIRELIIRKQLCIKAPVTSTIHCILEKHNLVKKKKRHSGYKATGTYLIKPNLPNDLWCADYKGQFKIQNQYCYPLTITDQASRYLLKVEGLENTREDQAFIIFKESFKEYGLPYAIRTDNGVPFATRSIFGLSKLSVWWLRLGIKVEKIAPGHPEENGTHERMHKTLKQDTIKSKKTNFLQQQELFDSFKEIFNHERPHEGINMKCPAEIYKKSDKQYVEQLEDFEYKTDRILRVSKCG
jgi:transposase InsO family protein